MEETTRWVAQVAAELGLDRQLVEQATTPVLDLVHDVAHGVARPAAPLTAFLVGLACGGRADGPTPAQVRATVAQLSALLAGWTPATTD